MRPLDERTRPSGLAAPGANAARALPPDEQAAAERQFAEIVGAVVRAILLRRHEQGRGEAA